MLTNPAKYIRKEYLSYLIESPHFLVWRWSKRLVYIYELQENERDEMGDLTDNTEEYSAVRSSVIIFKPTTEYDQLLSSLHYGGAT